VFLEATRHQNPRLLELAARLHHDGRIAPNTYVVDADTVAANAARTAEAGLRHGLRLNVMTKQFGRNPRIAELVAAAGLSRFVAVDVDEARVLWRAGLDVAHVGHLVGTSAYDAAEVASQRPDAVTVFNVEQARRIDAAATGHGHRQRLFLRMYDPTAEYHPGQHGGFLLDDLDRTLDELGRLRNVQAAGVTTHPCLTYDYDTGEGGATSKLGLLRAAAARLAEQPGHDGAVEINAPGVTCIATMPLLQSEGVTTGEPGSSLTGSTPLNAFEPQPEVPAIVYVTEVAHLHQRQVFVFGGGFYARGHVRGALVGRGGSMPETYLPAVGFPAEAIDYYGELSNEAGEDVRVGDTALYAFRNQVFVTRARVAVVEGLHDGGQPRVTGVYDSLGELLPGR
jgi:predicted amino acid racemase